VSTRAVVPADDWPDAVADGAGFTSKGYVYFAMGFSIFVEMINLRIRPVHAPVKKLHDRFHEQ
jgi:hypothetical protein